MERLTKKHDGSGSYTQFGDKYIPNHNIRHKQCVEKLGKLEDIEQELGIPLEVLFKALKEGVWVKHLPIERKNITYYKVCELHYYKESVWVLWICDRNGDEFIRVLKDYGKTWALTREELE